MAIIDAVTVKPRNWLKKTGDAMTAGFLTLFQDPTDPLHAVTKQYVDAGDSGGALDHRHLGLHQQNGRGITFAVLNLSTPSLVGTPITLVSDATGIYGNFPSTTLSGAVAGVNLAALANDFTMAALPEIYFVIKTGAAAADIDTDSSRHNGLSISGPSNLGMDGPSLTFRNNPSLGDGTTWWTGSSADGSSDGSLETTKNTGVMVSTDTRYVFRIRVVSTTSVEFYINGALVNTHTSPDNLPGALTGMSFLSYVHSHIAGTSRNHRYRRFQVQSL